jgi:tetratricopeptide (TPR) repeat protein
MTNEATVLVVEAEPLPEEFVVHLEAAGLFVEVTPPSGLAAAYTVVGPDLVVHVGAADADATVRFLKKEGELQPTRLVLVGRRAELSALRRLDRSVVQSVLARDIPEKLIVERILTLGRRALGPSPTPAASALWPSPVDAPRGTGPHLSAEQKIRVWVQSSRPPVISEKDEADEGLDAPEELPYDFAPYVGVTPPSEEPEDETERPPPPSVLPGSDENQEPEWPEGFEAPTHEQLMDLDDGPLPDAKTADALGPDGAALESSWTEPSTIEPAWTEPTAPRPAATGASFALSDAEDDDRDTVVIERSLLSLFHAEHEPTPAVAPTVNEDSAERATLAGAVSGPQGVAQEARGAFPDSPRRSGAPTRALSGPPQAVARSGGRSWLWGALAVAGLILLGLAIPRAKKAVPAKTGGGSTLSAGTSAERPEPIRDGPPATPGEPLAPPGPESNPVDPAAALRSTDAPKEQAAAEIWQVKENPDVSSCEELVVNRAQLRLGDTDQSSRLWKKARGLLLLGDMKGAQTALCEASLVLPSGLVTEALIEHLLTLGAPRLAEPLMARALKERPERPKTLELNGDVECQLGHSERARQLWLEALGVKEPSPPTLKQIARQIAAQAAQVRKGGQVALADRLYRRAAILDPNHKGAWLGLAEIADERGQPERAALFRQALETR